jgi:hypothetical protein
LFPNSPFTGEIPAFSGEIPARSISLRPVYQLIHLSLQDEQLLLHPSKQGNEISIVLIRHVSLFEARIIFHFAGLPFSDASGIGQRKPGHQPGIFVMVTQEQSIRNAA